MKKVFFAMLIAAMAVGTVAVAKTMGSTTKASPSASQSDYVCHCGGKLHWSAKAYQVKEECCVCKGKGYVGSGKYKYTCEECDGTGLMTVWKSGYVCERCGRVYSDD